MVTLYYGFLLNNILVHANERLSLCLGSGSVSACTAYRVHWWMCRRALQYVRRNRKMCVLFRVAYED